MTDYVVPSEVTAGDTWTWTIVDSDHKASAGWVLTYTLINATAKISITGSASNDDHLISVAAATTAPYTAGTYSWQGYVTKGAERYMVGKGTIKVLPNLAAATTLDNRSDAKKTLDAIEAIILNRASLDQQSYEIQGRKLVRTPLADLLVLRDKYKAIVLSEERAERIAQGLPTNNRVYVRF